MSIAFDCLHGARLCLLPHRDNRHRPLVLRHRSLAYISGLLIASKVLAVVMVSLVPISAQLSTITTDRIVQLTNEERKKAGLAELRIVPALTRAAQEKAAHMLQADYFAHISPDGVTPWFWIHKSGYAYQVAGENLAIDFFEAEDIVRAWMLSPSHKENLLHREYQETGVAVASGEFQGSNSIVVVHMFGRPLYPSATASAVASAVAPEVEVSVPSTASDTTPPRVPALHMDSQSSTVREKATFAIEGEPGSTVEIFVNTQLQETVRLPDSGVLTHDVPLTDVPDGLLTVRGRSLDNARNVSELSAPLTLTKDTTGPRLVATEVSFVLNPLTDRSEMAVIIPEQPHATLTFQQQNTVVRSAGARLNAPLSNEAFTLSLADTIGNVSTLHPIALTPHFSEQPSIYSNKAVRAVWQLAQRMSLMIFIGVSAVLLLTWFIRAHRTHTGLIAHSSWVILLAGIFFFL
jgi:hypothetical protein